MERNDAYLIGEAKVGQIVAFAPHMNRSVEGKHYEVKEVDAGSKSVLVKWVNELADYTPFWVLASRLIYIAN